LDFLDVSGEESQQNFICFSIIAKRRYILKTYTYKKKKKKSMLIFGEIKEKIRIWTTGTLSQ
jgi:hypothetical protein